jgi:succinylglutamate desuccinylase
MSSSNEICESIWKIDSGAPGKTVAVIGGTHGNELTGIEIVKSLRDDPPRINVGVLYLVLGNPRAIERGTRGSADHLDLNRQFTLDVLEKEPNGTYELERAKILAPIYAQCDVTIDIHSTNKPSEPMLLCTDVSPGYERLFQWFDCPRVLADPHTALIGQPSTTDDWTASQGGLGLAYESGQASDLSKVGVITESIKNVLRGQGLIAEPPSREPYFTTWEMYDLIEPIIQQGEAFTFASGRGESSFEQFNKGDLLGMDDDREVQAPYDGYMMFPKVKELQGKGKPMMFLAKKK